MKKLITVFFIIVGILGFILFSAPGQQKGLIPLVNLYLHYKVPRHTVRLTRLEPGWKSLRVEGTMDKTIRFEARGPVIWPKMLLRLNYRITGDEVYLEGKKYPVDLALTGTIIGVPKKLRVTGTGEAFGAGIDYRFLLIGSDLRGINLQAQGARVDQLLALAGLYPYAVGRLDLRIEMPRLDRNHPEGEIRFGISDGRLDRKALQRDFGIGLPAAEAYRLAGLFRLQNGLVRGNATLESPLLTLKLDAFRSDAALKIFKSRYTLEIPELSRLKALTKSTLFGPWAMDGAFFYDRADKKLQLQGESPSLDGTSSFFYDDDRLTLDFRQAGIPQLLALLGREPLVSSGRFDAHADFKTRQKLRGGYRINARGTWDREELAKVVGGDPGEDLNFTLQSEGSVSKGVLQAEADYRNRLFELKWPSIRYGLKSGAFEGRYRLVVSDLSRLAMLGKRGAAGALLVDGTAAYLPVKKLLKIGGESGSLGGETRFVYAGKRLSLTLKKVDAARTARLVGVPQLLNASELNGAVIFSDIVRKIGTFSVTIRGALNREAVQKEWKVDPGPGVTIRLKGKGEIHEELLRSQWHLESSLGTLALEQCRLRLDTGACRGLYRLKIPELERLSPLTGRRYRGPLTLTGQVARTKTLELDGGGKEWGGRLEYRLEGSLLRVNGLKLQAQELMKMLGYTPLIDGMLSCDLRFNLDTQKGTLGADLRQVHFIRSSLTRVASRILHLDLDKEIFKTARFSSRIDGPKLIFDFTARSKHLSMTVRRGKIDRKKGTVNAFVTIDKAGKRYRLQLRGPLERPQVIPLPSRDLLRNAQTELKRQVSDGAAAASASKANRSGESSLGDFIKKLF